MEGVAAIDEVRIEGEWGKLGFGEGRSNNTTTVLTTMKNGAKYSLSFWHLLNTMLFFFFGNEWIDLLHFFTFGD